MNFQMFKLVLEKAEEPEIKLPTSAGSLKKQESSRKTSICFIDYAKAFDCVDPNKLWKILKEMGIPDHLFIIGDWNAKVGSQETPGVTGKFGLGIRNEAGQRLIEFCQENTLVIANTLFQQYKRGLYTWTSPDGQHRNQIDYILCSQRWRSSI